MQLVIRALSKTYPNGTQALKDVSLDVPQGMFGLLGPNGAGKSTLMRIISTLQDPDSGSVHLTGGEGTPIDVLRQKAEVRKTLGYLPQSFGFYPRLKAERLLEHFAVLKGLTEPGVRRDVIESLLRRTNLWEVRRQKVGTFSGGMRQRLGVAIALLGNPKLIIVDEPTAGLDPAERVRFLNLLGEIGEESAVILSTHIVEDVEELCSQADRPATRRQRGRRYGTRAAILKQNTTMEFHAEGGSSTQMSSSLGTLAGGGAEADFVDRSSIVRRIWGDGDMVLLIFVGSAAEFALNRAVDWLFFTGKLPGDPIGRLFSTATYAQQIVFADLSGATRTLDRIRAVHQAVEHERGRHIPDWAHRDVLYMLIDYSERAHEMLVGPLSPGEQRELYEVFYRVGIGLRIPALPRTYASWRVDREHHQRRDLLFSSGTEALYAQYRNQLGPWRYQLLLRIQAMLTPEYVRGLLRLNSAESLRRLARFYPMLVRAGLRPIIQRLLMPSKYLPAVRRLHHLAANHSMAITNEATGRAKRSGISWSVSPSSSGTVPSRQVESSARVARIDLPGGVPISVTD